MCFSFSQCFSHRPYMTHHISYMLRNENEDEDAKITIQFYKLSSLMPMTRALSLRATPHVRKETKLGMQLLQEIK